MVYIGRKEFVSITNWCDCAQDVVPSFQSLHTSWSKPNMKHLEACDLVLAQCYLNQSFVGYIDGGSCHKHPLLLFKPFFKNCNHDILFFSHIVALNVVS